MAFLSYENIAITGISACVPKQRIVNNTLEEPFSGKTLEKTISTTGISERRVTSEEMCASDLCVHAAETLISEMAIDRSTIDLVLFVTQSPDFRLPATAPNLQHRLSLEKTAGAFDINMGCSGYVYGLSVAFGYAAQKSVRRVLLLVGDTPSKYVSSKDKTTGILFGDGGTATMIEKVDGAGTSFFSLNSDGSGVDALKIPAGGYRKKSGPETVTRVERKDGSVRSEEELTMDGAAIFNFTIREVPKDIKNLIEQSGTPMASVDYIIYHQANKFITDHLTKKLKYPLDNIPYSLDKYGNTTCLTIPVTIVSELKEALAASSKKVIMSGFGIGLSWATALMDLNNCHICEMIEV